MVSMISEEGRTKVGIYEYVIDTATELSQVPTDVQVGSIVYCIENSKKYMLDSSGSYVEVNFKKGGSGGEAKLGTKDIDENGSYKASDFDLDGWSQVNVNISGTSNIVFGDFTISTAGVHEVSVPYNGNGYPVTCLIWPEDGFTTEVTDTVYEVCFLGFVKTEKSTEPDYTGVDGLSKNKARVATTHRRSGSAMGGDARDAHPYSTEGAKAITNNSSIAIFKDKNTLSVYGQESTSYYGLSVGTKYRYMVEYSE